MNPKIELILKKHNIGVELKGYKEMQSTDGYHMRGTLYVNGKKGILFEDLGFGGGCDYSILNQENAKPLLDIKEEMEEIKAYPDSDTISDISYDLENLFYEMAEDLLILKRLRKYAKTGTLIRWGGEEYEKGVLAIIERQYSIAVLNHILKRMVTEKIENVWIWNESEKWISYSVEELENLVKGKQ